MPISSRDLLNQSKGLPVPEETGLRMLAGRAYYACYRRCLDWEQSLPRRGKVLNVKKKGRHQQLIERLQRPDKTCSRDQVERSHWLAKKLSILRSLRVRADYHLDDVISDEEASGQVSLADALFKRCGWGEGG